MREKAVSVVLVEQAVVVVVIRSIKYLMLVLFALGCQVQNSETTPNANVCRNPPSLMYSDYQNDVENQVIQNLCFECHNSQGSGRRISYTGSVRDNFCIVFALGPNHPERVMANYPSQPGHISASGRTFTSTQLQPLVDWVNRYAR